MEKCGSPCHCIIEPLPIIEKAAEKLRIFSSLFFGSDTATPPPPPGGGGGSCGGGGGFGPGGGGGGPPAPPKKKEWKKMPGWGHFSSRGSPQEPHFPICPPPPPGFCLWPEAWLVYRAVRARGWPGRRLKRRLLRHRSGCPAAWKPDN